MKYKVLAFIAFLSFQLFAQKKNQNIGFAENKGQIIDQKGRPNPAVKFLLNSSGLNVQLRKNGFSYDVYETKKHPLTEKQKKKQRPTDFLNNDKDKFLDYTLEYIYHRIDIDFVNSNPNVEFIKEGKSTDYDNYYNVVSKPEGVTNVHKFKQLTYKNIYPNIDVVFFIPKDSLKSVEYNFIVHPNGKTSDIQMKFKGAQTDLANNKIKMKVRFGKMEETLPMSWTENGNEKKEIAIGYRRIKANIYGFENAETISDKTLIIDPVPVRLWGTYYSVNSGSFDANSITVDNNGNVFFTGQANSFNNNIATSGTFQNFLSTGSSAFIAKLNQNGQRLWGTYVSNSSGNTVGYTNISDAIVNSKNELYIVGDTFNTNPTAAILTTANSFKQYESGFNSEGLMMKFDANGQRIWGTFYGGERNEQIHTISLDSDENIIIAGETYSKTGISTPNAYQQNILYDFYGCGFIAKFTAAGARTYGTYFPGKINYSAVDNNGNLIFAGQYREVDTYTPNITTAGTHQNQIHNMDGFILKLNSSGEQRLWCTYYGGDASFSISVSDYLDQIKGLGVDAKNNIYITGLTNSINLIATPGAFKLNQAVGSVDSFVAKFNSTGQIQWGTYFGSDISIQTNDRCSSGFVSPNGDIYITGNTRSDKDISTLNSYQNKTNGSDEGFIAKFNTNGGIEWGTYYGSDYQDFPQDIFFKKNKLYIIGNTTYSGFRDPLPFGTIGTHDPYGYGLFIAEFQDCLSSPETSSNSPICIGSTLELKASGGTNYAWIGPNGFTSTDQNPTITNATALNTGKYSCNITGTGGCDGVVTVDVLVGDTTAPIPNLSSLPTITETCNAIVSTIPTATDNCAGTITGTTTNPLVYDLAGTYTIVWNYDDGNGNKSTQNQTVIVNPNANVIAQEVNYSLCDDNSDGKETFDLSLKQAEIINLPDYTFSYFKNENDALLQTNKISNPSSFENEINPQTIYVRVLNTANNCSSLSKIILNVNPKPIVSNSVLSKCDSFLNGIQTFDLDDAKTQINASANLTFQYFKSSQDLNNGIAITNPNSFSNTINNQIVFAKVSDTNTCFTISELTLVVNPINQKTLTDFIKCDDDYDGKVLFDFSEKNNEISSYLGTDNYTYSYYTDPKDAALGNSNTINPLYLNTSNNEIIYIRVIGTTGCSSLFKVKLEILEKPKMNMKDNWSICKGISSKIEADSGFDTYLWSTGEKTSTIKVKQSGAYFVTVTKDYGTTSCSTTKNITIISSNKAQITNVETIDWTDTENRITIYVSGEGNYEYSINGTDYQDNNQFSDLNKGEFIIYVRDKNGCGIVKEEVYLLMYPKFFTPNGDGSNDNWKIKFSENEPNLKIEIFDRYGKLIKQLLKNSSSWDGTLDGKNLPSTDYWFVVTRANGKEHRGHFSLKR